MRASSSDAISERLEALHASSRGPASKERDAQSFLSWVAQWSRRRRSVGLTHVLVLDGVPSETDETASFNLFQYWAPRFAPREPALAWAVADLSAHVVNVRKSRFADLDFWAMSFERFDERLSHTKNSACGPDGKAYIFWRHAPHDVRFRLRCVYRAMLVGHHPPPAFNHALFVFLGKGVEASDIEHDKLGQLHRSPKNTRPLSLSNCSAKAVAGGLSDPLGELASETVQEAQQGGIRGRTIVRDVLDVETASRAASYQSVRAAALFFDSLAAFPSLVRGYLRWVLRAMGLPDAIISFIQMLYSDNVRFIMLRRRLFHHFVVVSGVRQGCPLSGLLFALSQDPFIRFQVSKIHGLVRAYYDDLAFVHFDLVGSGGDLLADFGGLGGCSGLRLNHSKCALLPLLGLAQEWISKLRAKYPVLLEWSVTMAAKYLDVRIGLDIVALLCGYTPLRSLRVACGSLGKKV